jgi:hypothetical protein
MRSKLLAVPFTLALVLSGVACSDDAKDDARDTLENARENAEDMVTEVSEAAGNVADNAVEVAARNLASAQGEDEFAANGIDVEGDLTCEATSNGDKTAIEVSCTGTATDGSSLSLEGVTSEMPGASLTELEGEFTGSADGEEVFSVDTLGG